MGMSEVWGKKIHRAEQLEMDFLGKMGIDTVFNYSEIEGHVDALSDIILEGSAVEDAVGLTEEELNDKLAELQGKTENIEMALKVLKRMRGYIEAGMKGKTSSLFSFDDGLKETLLSCIEEAEEDLAE